MAAELKDKHQIVPTGRIVLLTVQGIAEIAGEQTVKFIKDLPTHFGIHLNEKKSSPVLPQQNEKEI